MSRKIDGLIGVHLFGHTPSKVKGVLYNPPYYSTNWGAAQFIIEEMRKRETFFLITTPLKGLQEKFHVQCCNKKALHLGEAEADTLPLAVALAALKALGVEIGGKDADQG